MSGAQMEHLYLVEVCGYAAEPFRAGSVGAARYAAFRAFRDAVTAITFRDFLSRVTTVVRVR